MILGGHMYTIPPASQQENLPNVPSSLIPLQPTLWLDLDGALIIREREEILLTAREVEVLRILVRVMLTSRNYLRANVIAQQLGLSEAFDPEHCVEQTISMIRR